ncbi:hypothetical protein YC2023_063263 [Brassica napus]
MGSVSDIILRTFALIREPSVCFPNQLESSFRTRELVLIRMEKQTKLSILLLNSVGISRRLDLKDTIPIVKPFNFLISRGMHITHG